MTPEAIERLAAAQEAWLAAAARLLAPGGFLLYSTCSLEEEENERVVGSVLARDSRLSLAPIDAPEGLAALRRGLPLSALSRRRTRTASPPTSSRAA